MYEYEYINNQGEHFFFWGYSEKDMKRRNPSTDFSELTMVYSEYID